MVKVVAFAHENIKTQCASLEDLAQVAGKEKLYNDIKSPPKGLQGAVDGRYAVPASSASGSRSCTPLCPPSRLRFGPLESALAPVPAPASVEFRDLDSRRPGPSVST